MNIRVDAVLHDAQLSTPTLVLDFHHISATYDRFTDAFPGGVIDYAVKANANPDILRLVVNRGGGLEIASLAELELALDAGADGAQIICSNPIKNPTFLRRMAEVGVYAIVIDSIWEIEKIAQHAPGSRVYVRLAVDNTGSVLPLAGKFGVDAALALELIDRAAAHGLQPIGLSFHVGSQCLNPANWANAIRACGDVWRAAEARGHHLYFLDIGGGFPAGHHHTPSIPTIEAIGAVTMQAVRDFIPFNRDLMLVLEPGRGLVGEAGTLLVSVVGKAVRGAETWLYLDAGVFNGLMETFEGFPPVVRPLKAADRPLRQYTLAGPSCDSCDVIARGIWLPEVEIGDRLVFLDAGAYTNEYAAAFNGFPIPAVCPVNAQAIGAPQFESAIA
jgi:ornithine decarboxylase